MSKQKKQQRMKRDRRRAETEIQQEMEKTEKKKAEVVDVLITPRAHPREIVGGAAKLGSDSVLPILGITNAELLVEFRKVKRVKKKDCVERQITHIQRWVNRGDYAMVSQA